MTNAGRRRETTASRRCLLAERPLGRDRSTWRRRWSGSSVANGRRRRGRRSPASDASPTWSGRSNAAPARPTLSTHWRGAWASARFHFIRTFHQLTGVSPHQYVMRARLREAVARLVDASAKVLDVGLDCGFGDASNFTHAFRPEFGVSPRAFRLARSGGGPTSPDRLERHQ